jgi:hypothetical protein
MLAVAVIDFVFMSWGLCPVFVSVGGCGRAPCTWLLSPATMMRSFGNDREFMMPVVLNSKYFSSDL